MMTLLLCTRIDHEWDHDTFRKCLAGFPPAQQDKITGYRFWKDRHLSLVGKMQVLHGLRYWYNLTVTVNDLRCSMYGRPFLPGGPDFNITHSGDYVVCAFDHTARVGVDIEEIRALSVDDFQSQFDTEEWTAIQRADEKYRMFYNFWTRKEAVIKADGRGINLPLNQIRVVEDTTLVDSCRWHLTAVPLDVDYCLHIARDGVMSAAVETVLFAPNDE